MTDLDLERLGDLWRQRPTAEEMDSLRRTADIVQRKARWGQRFDSSIALVVAIVVIILVVSNPTFDTMLVGGAAILVLLLSQARTRRFRAEELRSLTGSTQEMLDQSIGRAQATLKRTRFQLIAIAPSFVLGLGVAALVDRNSGAFYTQSFSEMGLGLAMMVVAALVLAALAVSFTRSLRSTRAELEKLTVLRDSFQAEAVKSATDKESA